MWIENDKMKTLGKRELTKKIEFTYFKTKI